MSRIVRAGMRTGAIQATRLLGSLLCLSLASPPRHLYLVTPTLRNTVLISNDFGQLDALLLGSEGQSLTLGLALSIMSERGTDVRIIHAPDGIPDGLLDLLPGVHHRAVAVVRSHGLFSELFSLQGRLVYADHGVDIAGDEIVASTDPEEVNRALLEASSAWEELA